MKKLFVNLITIISLVCLSTLVGCQDHQHSYSNEWSTSATEHWHACLGCEEKKDVATHDGAICSICGHNDGTIATWSGNSSQNLPEIVENVLTLTTPEELASFSQEVNNGTDYKGVTVVLANDVNLNNLLWTPIGNSTNKFKGTFDGNNKTIYNLTAGAVGQSNVGLFGFTTDGEIKNLSIINATIVGRLNVGVVAGTPYTAKYNNISVKGLVKVDGLAYVGGVFGKNVYANVSNITVDVLDGSYVKGHSIEYSESQQKDVAYRTYVGGVIGFMGEGGHTVSNVTSNIDVLGSTIDVGGITGIAHYGNNFVNCSSSGDVTIYLGDAQDQLEIGGIAGVWHNGGANVTLENCSFTGNLSVTFADGTTYNGEYANNNLCGVAYASTGSGQLIIK